MFSATNDLLYRIARWTCCSLSLLAIGWSPPTMALDPTRAIDSYAIETWDTDQGLPHNLVQAIAQTPDGYLWFGSWEGVARFNAWEFRVFDAERDHVLRNNGVRGLARGSDGALWIGTSEGGLTRFQDGRWRQFGKADGLPDTHIRSLLASADGRIWLGTEESGVIVYDGRKFTVLNTRLPHALVLSLAEGHDGSIWIGTVRGLLRWKDNASIAPPAFAADWQPAVFSIHEDAKGVVRVGTEKGLYRVVGDRMESETDDLPLAQDSISAITEDRDGNLWVGSFQNGLARVRDRHVELLTQRDGLPHNRVAALLVDREGSLWVGTGLGLARLGDAPFTTLDARRGLSDSYVRTVAQDSGGALWVGTGNGLNRLKDGRFEAFFPSGKSAGSSIMSLFPSRDGSLWIGTRDAGLAHFNGKDFHFLSTSDGLAGSQVRALRETRDGSLWVGTSAGLSHVVDGKITNFDRDDGLPRSYVMALYEDRSGRLWAGTSNGVAVYEDGKFRDLSAAPGAPQSDVFDFHQDADGGLWMATSGGVFRYRDSSFSPIPLSAGELPRQLFSVLEDGTGFLWFSSNAGVYRVARSDLDLVAEGSSTHFESMRYGHRDGMATSQCNGSSQPAAWRAEDGRLWFATAGGAAVVDPRHSDIGPVRPPPIVVERVLVDGDVPPTAQDFEVAAGTRRISFEYAALAYRRPDHVNYRFRLAGFESDWVPVGAQRATVFTNLKPGEYSFEVEPDEEFPGFEKTRASVRFRVLPHFYETAWFYLLAGLLLLLAAVLVYRLRVAGLMRRKLKLETLVAERTEALAEETRKLQSANEEKNVLLDKVREQAEAFERLSSEDVLTALPNRRHFDAWLREEFARCRKDLRPISVAAIDLDHFKQINDRHSHAIGDAALRVIAEYLRGACADIGMPARYGGEEFAIAFPGLDAAQAALRCERLRADVQGHDWSRLAPGLQVTISVGISDHAEAATHERLLALADEQLYAAKKAGRNRVCR